jgi:hypothetical protein
MQPRQRIAKRAAVNRRRPPNPHAVQESDHRRRPAGEATQHLAVLVLDRLRAADATRVQMLHQAEKKRQVLGRHAPFVEREDEVTAARMDEEVRVLHTFRDTLVGEQLPDVVIGEKRRKLLRHHIGIDGHVHPSCARSRLLAVFGKVAATSLRHMPAGLAGGFRIFPSGGDKNVDGRDGPAMTTETSYAARELIPPPRVRARPAAAGRTYLHRRS